MRNFATSVCLAVEQKLVSTDMFKRLTMLSLTVTPNWPLSDFLPFLLAAPNLHALDLSCSDFGGASSVFQDAMACLQTIVTF